MPARGWGCSVRVCSEAARPGGGNGRIGMTTDTEKSERKIARVDTEVVKSGPASSQQGAIRPAVETVSEMARQEQSQRLLVQAGMVVVDVFIFIASFVMAFILTHDTFGLEDIRWFSGLNPEAAAETGMSIVWRGMPLPMWSDFYPYLVGILIPLPIIRLVVMSRLHLYRLQGEISRIEDVIETFRAVTIGSILMIVLVFSFGANPANPVYAKSHQIFPVDWLICLIGCAGFRLVVRQVQIGARKRSRNLTPVLLVGKGRLAKMIEDELTRDPVIGYRIEKKIEAEGDDPDILDKLKQIPYLIEQTGVREVFFATQRITQMQLFPILMQSRGDVNFKVVPDLLGLRPKKVDITKLRYVPLLEIFVDPLRGANGFMKRLLDLSVALLGLSLLAVPMLIVAILIKLDSRGPVIFKQTRMGLDFRPFPFYKFRSMRIDTDHSRHEEFMRQVIERGQGAVDEETGKVVFKEKDDPRITRVGKFIRKYSIDELPQIFNVIKGEMSIVGPRPPVPYEVAMYREHHMLRLSIRPGITGLWQVSGRNSVSFDEMVRMDVTYMENWSLLTDIKIILQTVPVVLFPKNTY
jgi:exopolysaccharide biosynthesis polyprenyl glycosylphosphotransferase